MTIQPFITAEWSWRNTSIMRPTRLEYYFFMTNYSNSIFSLKARGQYSLKCYDFQLLGPVMISQDDLSLYRKELNAFYITRISNHSHKRGEGIHFLQFVPFKSSRALSKFLFKKRKCEIPFKLLFRRWWEFTHQEEGGAWQ